MYYELVPQDLCKIRHFLTISFALRLPISNDTVSWVLVRTEVMLPIFQLLAHLAKSTEQQSSVFLLWVGNWTERSCYRHCCNGWVDYTCRNIPKSKRRRRKNNSIHRFRVSMAGIFSKRIYIPFSLLRKWNIFPFYSLIILFPLFLQAWLWDMKPKLLSVLPPSPALVPPSLCFRRWSGRLMLTPGVLN